MRSSWFQKGVSVLLATVMLLQLVATPIAYASGAGESVADLRRRTGESLDLYLERVATMQPQLFQQAALAAVQDSFNGNSTDSDSEDALEERVAFYVDQAVARSLDDPFGVQANAQQHSALALQPAAEDIVWSRPATDPTGQLVGEMTLASSLPAGFDPTQRAISQAKAVSSADAAFAAVSQIATTSDVIFAKRAVADAMARPIVPTDVSRLTPQAAPRVELPTQLMAATGVDDTPLTFLPQPMAVTVDPNTKTIGKMRVEADTISNSGSGFEATGVITLSADISGTGEYVNYVTISGANAKVEQAADGKVTGTGTVQVHPNLIGNTTPVTSSAWTDVFTGTFGISNTLSISVELLPANSTITTTIEKVGGFALQNGATLSRLGLKDGGMTLAAKLHPLSLGLKVEIPELDLIMTPDKKYTVQSTDISFVLAGMTVLGKHMTWTEADGIQSTQVSLTLPDELGGETIAIDSVKITTSSFKFGGVEDTFKLPDIHLLGKSGSASRAVGASSSSSVKLINNTATLVDKEGALKLIVKGTLEIKLPDNQQTIAVEFDISEDGEFDGKLDTLTLKLPGSKIDMTKLDITNEGLKVETAKFTLDFVSEKDGQKLTETIQKVLISGGGISIGEADILLPWPEIKLGSAAHFYHMVAELKIADDITMDITGTLDLKLPDNPQQTISVTAKMDKDGNFSGSISTLTVTVAHSTLVLESLVFDENSISAAQAKLTLPEILNSAVVTIDKVTIDDDGLRLSDATADIGDVKLGSIGELKGATVQITNTDGEYTVKVIGDVELDKLPKASSASIKGNLVIHPDGHLTGDVSGFKVDLVGLSVEGQNVHYSDGVLTARIIEVGVPEDWGGASAEVDNLHISDQGVSISGGKFELPQITIGDIGIELKGQIEQIDDGYRITADGTFQLPSSDSGGCGGIEIAATITVTSTRDVVLSIEPPADAAEDAPAGANEDGRAVDTLNLEQAQLTLSDCYIAIGTTGFGVTKVSGEVTLTSNVTEIDIKVTVSTSDKFQVKGRNAVDVNGEAKFVQKQSPAETKLSITGAVEIFALFQAANADIEVDFLNDRFSADLHVTAVVFDGGLEFAAWESSSEFFLTGRGYLNVGVQKGSVASEHCTSIPWVKTGYWYIHKYWRQVCTPAIPTGTEWLARVLVEAGRFTNDAWGAKAKVDLFDTYEVGVYMDDDGNVSYRNVDQYQLATGREAQAARTLQLDLSRGVLARSALTVEQLALVEGYEFAPDQTDINFTVQHATPTTIAFRHPPSGEVGLALVAPNGLIVTEQNQPTHITFATVSMPDPDRPEDTIIESVITIRDSQVGDWKLRLDANSSAEDPFGAHIVGIDPGPEVHDLRVVASGEDAAQLIYDIDAAEANTTVRVYASLGPISDTIEFTTTETTREGESVTVSESLPAPKYEGTLLKEFTVANAARTSGQADLDLSGLETGDYYIWISADDGANHPTRQYAHGTTGHYGKLHVQNLWSPTWTATVTPTIDYHGVDLDWESSTNPDVDAYEVVITTKDNFAPIDTDDVHAAGSATFMSLSGLKPKQRYYVTIVGIDNDTGQKVDSQRLTLDTLEAAFTVEPATSDISVVSGGEAVSVTLTLRSDVAPFPDGVHFYIDDSQLANAGRIKATVSDSYVMPNAAGVQTTLLIEAADQAMAESGGSLMLEAIGGGNVVEVPLNLTVVEPSFTIQSDVESIVLSEDGSVVINLSALYADGEQDAIKLDIDAPHGMLHQLSSTELTPNGSVMLTLTDSAELVHGSYDTSIEVIAWDGEHERTTQLPVYVDKPTFELSLDWSADLLDAFYNTFAGDFNVNARANVNRVDWTHPITVDLLSSAYLSPTTPSELSSWQTSAFIRAEARHDMPMGKHFEIEVVATSNGITKTLPIRVFTRSGSFTMMNNEAGYESYPSNGVIVAGESYSIAPTFTTKGYLTFDKVLTETLGAGDAYLSLVEIQKTESCTLESGQMICDAGGNLWVDGGYPVEMALAPDAPTGHVITHTATIEEHSPRFQAPVKHNNTAHLALKVVRHSDLAVTLSASDAIAGGTMVYTATVVNNGPSVADNVNLSVATPDVSVQSMSSGCAQDSNADVECAVGTLAVGETATVTVNALVADYLRGSVDARALALSDSIDPSETRNELATLNTSVGTSVALDVVASGMSGSVTQNGLITYTVAITNTGSSEATDVKFQYERPNALVLAQDAQVEYVLNGAVTHHFTVDDVDETLNFNNLAPNEQARIILPMYAQYNTQNSLIGARSTFNVWSTESTTMTKQLTNYIANVAPTVEIAGGETLTVSEGMSLTLQAIVTDTRHETLSIGWDLDNDGSYFDAYGSIVTFNASALNGDATQVIGVQVRDSGSNEATDTATIVIKNVAPLVIAGDEQHVEANEAVQIAATFADPGANDSQTAQINWGDGTIENVSVTRSGSVDGSHVYNSIGRFNANVCVTDSDGAIGCDVVEVTSSCVEHGATIMIDSIEATNDARTQVRITFTVTNGSGVYTLPAGTAVTLFAGSFALHTTTLTNALTVGQSETFTYDWATGTTGTHELTARFNDSGGTPSDALLCALDDNGVSRIQDVRKMRLPLDQAPVAMADTYTGSPSEPIHVLPESGLLANDTDADNDAMTVRLVSKPTTGVVLLQPDGSFMYAPQGAEAGPAPVRQSSVSFTYAVSDGVNEKIGMVTINLMAENDAEAMTAEISKTLKISGTRDVTVDIPVGAVPSNTLPTIVLAEAALNTLPASPFDHNTVTGFTLTALLHGKAQSMTFATPVTIAAEYGGADFSDTDESTLKLYVYHQGRWVDAASTCATPTAPSVDTVSKTITTQVCVTGPYALQGVDQTPIIHYYFPFIAIDQQSVAPSTDE